MPEDRILPDSTPLAAPRQTLAMRMAERSRLRAERAERLARLGPAREPAREPPGEPPGELPSELPGAERAEAPAPVPFAGPERDAAAALEEFLRSLTQGLRGLPRAEAPPAATAPPGAVLPFQRPPAAEGRAAPCDLGRLQGAGPGLVWALRRAGIPDLAGLAALEPEELAARLGSLGRLVPARAWVNAARGDSGA